MEWLLENGCSSLMYLMDNDGYLQDIGLNEEQPKVVFETIEQYKNKKLHGKRSDNV